MLPLEAAHVQRVHVEEHTPVPGRTLGPVSLWGKRGVRWELTTGLPPRLALEGTLTLWAAPAAEGRGRSQSQQQLLLIAFLP